MKSDILRRLTVLESKIFASTRSHQDNGAVCARLREIAVDELTPQQSASAAGTLIAKIEDRDRDFDEASLSNDERGLLAQLYEEMVLCANVEARDRVPDEATGDEIKRFEQTYAEMVRS